MINSFCIKTNNKSILDYLLSEFENISLNGVYFSSNKFKTYKNTIIHYRGSDSDSFLKLLSNILSNTILDFYETQLLRKIINTNYFYFLDAEKKEILNKSQEILLELKNNRAHRKNIISVAFFNYLKHNKSLIMDGFINFRLKEYMKILDNAIDLAVDRYLIDREYHEFITLLKLYIDSKDTIISKVHLIYLNNESILLDNDKHIIKIDDNIFNSKYLSDISFSSNDYALNTLLNVLPNKLYIHLIDSNEDEFISTLKLIFDKRVYMCRDCKLCAIYKANKGLSSLVMKD